MALLEFDQGLLDDVAARFDLRAPNKAGLEKAIKRIAEQDSDPTPLVLDLATGVGKTYLLAALLDYAADQGVKNMLVVLPGRTVRSKTINNFTPGADGYIDGADHEKTVVTMDNFESQADAIHDPHRVKLFLTNVHNLEPDFTVDHHGLGNTKKATYRGARLSEELGGRLLEHIAEVDDLLMVLDESHSYSETAKAWSAALDRLSPAARVGLTATPKDGDNVIYRYSLADAIRDRHVKTPVVAMRRDGYRDNAEIEQLRDAMRLLERKMTHYRAYEHANPTATPINPIMLVACRDTAHADEIADVLRSPKLFGSDDAVLVIHSDAMTAEAERALAEVQRPESPVRAIVQVQMLTEGWNVHNVAVLVPLRALESATFTEQLIGRGLRLPYHAYTGDEMVDSLDILSHESVRSAMKKHGIGGRRRVDDSTAAGGAPVPGSLYDVKGADEPSPGGDELSSGDILASSVGVAAMREAGGSGVIPLDPSSSGGTGGIADATAALGGGARDIDAVEQEDERGEVPEVQWVQARNPETIMFPSVRLVKDTARFSVSGIDRDEIARIAAGAQGDHYTDALEREIVILNENGSVRFDGAVQALIELETDEIPIGAVTQTVELEVLKRVGALFNGVEGKENRRQLPGVIHRVTEHMTGTWSAKRAVQLADVLILNLQSLADAFARNRPTNVVIVPTPIPKREPVSLAIGEKIHNWRTVKDNPRAFERYRFYKGWTRDRFTASRFDAYSTEFKLAAMLDMSDNIDSWMRLEPADKATIEFLPGRPYFPDFVAIDTAGVHWIIEGKAEHGRDDTDVQKKRQVAEQAVRTMEIDAQWQSTRWAYLIAYESSVARAETWTNLKTAANPEMMRDQR